MELVKVEKDKITDFTKEIFEKNYKQQIMILLNEFHNEEDGFIERNEKILAKFAWKSVNNIENFIVSYLNRLIHGLASVSEKLKVNVRFYLEINVWKVTLELSNVSCFRSFSVQVYFQIKVSTQNFWGASKIE